MLENGKPLIMDIQNCTCKQKDGSTYILTCKVKERDTYDYTFTLGDNYIVKRYDNMKLYITNESIIKITNAISLFDFKVFELKGYTNEINIYYNHQGPNKYDFLVEYKDKDFIYENIEVPKFIFEITLLFFFYNDISFNFRNTGKHNLKDNPIYIAATQNQDKQLECELKLFYRIANKEDCDYLSRLWEIKILPPLNEEFDKDFVVDNDTISMKILNDSGYKILRQPSFSMEGNTHDKWLLNPHTKTGVDAAKANAESMTFLEYVDMVEKVK